jgi:hypothetical protein
MEIVVVSEYVTTFMINKVCYHQHCFHCQYLNQIQGFH